MTKLVVPALSISFALSESAFAYTRLFVPWSEMATVALLVIALERQELLALVLLRRRPVSFASSVLSVTALSLDWMLTPTAFRAEVFCTIAPWTTATSIPAPALSWRLLSNTRTCVACVTRMPAAAEPETSHRVIAEPLPQTPFPLPLKRMPSRPVFQIVT